MKSQPIRVAVQGALGKVGVELVAAILHEPDLKLVGGADLKATDEFLPLADKSVKIPLFSSVDKLLVATKPDVLVDFSIAAATMPAVRACTSHGVRMVIGTTGLKPEDIAEMERLANEKHVGIVMAANFALGAVLMMHLAKIAAKYMDWAEIIEQHYYMKADAPSGTSIATARGMAQAHGQPLSRPTTAGEDSDSRGRLVEGVRIHSVRLPGFNAHQEVILGAPGQTLTIRHDALTRECYAPGVILAVREVVKRDGFTFGLEPLLGL